MPKEFAKLQARDMEKVGAVQDLVRGIDKLFGRTEEEEKERIAETEKYLLSDKARECKPTKYAVTKGAYVSNKNGNCMWWLRSPDVSRQASGVIDNGSVDYNGSNVGFDYVAVRPALWINLK